MSKQAKNKKINLDKIKIQQLQNKIYELDYLLQVKYQACDELLKDNKVLTVQNAKLVEQVKMKDNNIQLWKDKFSNLERESEILKAENYNLKHKGIFKKIQSLIGV